MIWLLNNKRVFMILYRVILLYACYGVIIKNEYIVEAPPIAKWMIGKHINYIRNWVINKGGTFQKIRYV